MTPRRETFSYRAKSELTRLPVAGEHDAWAELLGLVRSAGALRLPGQGRVALELRTEHPAVARKAFALLKHPAGVQAQVLIRFTRRLGSHQSYVVVASPLDPLPRVLQLLGVVDAQGHPLAQTDKPEAALLELTRTRSAKRAFLRGLFLGAGTVAHPERAHHLEIVLASPTVARFVLRLLRGFGLRPGQAQRKAGVGLYFKDADAIVEFLRIVGAARALLQYEDVRILKEVKSQVNRRVNAETANLRKTANAAARQLEAIRSLVEAVGWERLPPSLRAVARARLEHPDLSLRELGEVLAPRLGKSGVNHRLRELERLASVRNCPN